MKNVIKRFVIAIAMPAFALAAMPAFAETTAGMQMKNTAIIGTAVSWIFALIKNAPAAGDCIVHGNGDLNNWGVRAQAGTDSELKMFQLGAERRNCDITQVGSVALDVAPIASLGWWHADSDSAYNHNAFDVAYVPMLHWVLPVSTSLQADLEFGIGPMYMSQPNIGNRIKSTGFQFSDQFGIGIGSTDGKWRVGFAFRHVSNLDIQDPNTAVDFKGIAISYRP